MKIMRIHRRACALALCLVSVAAGASEAARTDRKGKLVDLQSREGKTSLAALNTKEQLDELLKNLDFFSSCDAYRNPLPISAEDFILYNAKSIASMLAWLEVEKKMPAANIIAKVRLYEKVNEAKRFLLAENKTVQEAEDNRRQARDILMGLTVDEFLEAVPVEIKYYDRIANVACDLIGPERIAGKTVTSGRQAPRINVQGLAMKKLKENWQQGFLKSSEAADPARRASTIHLYPDNTLFDAPEEYIDDTIAALISHELIHGYQHQLNGVTTAACETGTSAVSLRKRTETTRVQLDADAWKLHEKKRAQILRDQRRISAAAGAGAGYLVGKVLLGKTTLGAPSTAAIGAGIGAAQPKLLPSLRDLPSLEYEADVEGVLLACKRGYHVEGFRQLFINMENGPEDARLGPFLNQSDVIAGIDIAEEANKYEEAKKVNGASCTYHPDTRLRYVNLMATANAFCPKEMLAPRARRPTSDTVSPVAGSTERPVPATSRQPRQAALPTPGPRLIDFRKRCLDNDACMRAIVDNAPEIIRVSGKVPGQAHAPSGQQPGTPSPGEGPGQGASDGEARTADRVPDRIALSNGYCDTGKMPGKWTGRYSHSGVWVPFELELAEAAGALTGESTEPDMRPGQSGMVTARWAGVGSEQGIVFERYYHVAPSTVSHYYGYCNKENTIISGEWRLGESLSGQFDMLKK